jgi:CRISPR system Cascade subunit CasE
VKQQTKTTHMIQMWLDTRRLMQLGKMLHLPLKQVGNNYIVHCALSELFQDQAPKALQRRRQSPADCRLQRPGDSGLMLFRSGLGDAPESCTEVLPAQRSMKSWTGNRMASKPMPTEFPEGMELRF